MLEPLVKLGNYLQQHQSGLDVRWMMKVIEEARQQQTEHLEHVEAFLQEMYATMIDPVEQPNMTVTEMCALLLKTAQQQRELAYAQSLQQAAAPTGKCGLPHSLPTVYHPCCLAKGHNPEDMHLFMPIQVSETYYCTPAPQPVADPSKEELKAAPIEIGWLIEKIGDDRPQWLTCAWTFGCTDDAGNAIRFCRRDDAEQIATMMENDEFASRNISGVKHGSVSYQEMGRSEMSRATELMVNAHDLNELDMFRRYLHDMHTMNFRKSIANIRHTWV